LTSNGTVKSIGPLEAYAGIEIVAGNLEISQGEANVQMNINSLTGDIRSVIGDVIAQRNVISIAGNIVADSGNVEAYLDINTVTGNITAQDSVISNTGDISSLLGSVYTRFSFIGNELNVVQGEIGNLTTNTLYSTNSIESQGTIIASASIKSLSGDIETMNGTLIGGDIFSLDTITANYNIRSVSANITADAGFLVSYSGGVAAGTIQAINIYSDQDIISLSGDIKTNGSIRANDIVTQDLTILGSLQAYDTVTIESGSLVIRTGDIAVTGNALVSGDVQVDGKLDVQSTITTLSTITSGSIQANGNITGISVTGRDSVSTQNGHITATNGFLYGDQLQTTGDIQTTGGDLKTSYNVQANVVNTNSLKSIGLIETQTLRVFGDATIDGTLTN